MIKIVEDHWPLVVALVQGEITEADIAAMFEVYERIHQRDERFFLVQEARGAKLPDAITRKRLAELNTHFAEQIERHVIAVGVVVASRIAAGVLSAIFWLSREATEMFTSLSGEEVYEKAVALCEREGVSLPEAAREFMLDLDAAQATPEGLSQYF